MADEKEVLSGGQGDRVGMLSIGKDGKPDQHDPSLIGDREAILELTRTQLRQQAASDAGRAADRDAATGDLPAQDVEDPSIAEAQKRNEAAIAAGDAAAESVVGALFSDEVRAAEPAPSGRRRAAEGKTEQ